MVLINQKNCVTERKNIGLPDCIIQEGRLTGYILVPKAWSLNLTSGTFDLDYVNSQIQLGNFIPFLGAVEAVNGTPEAVTEEYQGGIMAVVRNGLPYYTFKFLRGGWKFASALYTYNSFQAYDVLFVFASGAIAGATNGTAFTGFELGMLNGTTYMFTDGATSSSVSSTMQLTNEVQFNRDVAILDSSVLDFKANTDILPITDIVLKGTADASENKIYVTAQYAINEASTLMGIASANLRLFVNGVADVIVSTTYNTLTGKYEIVPTATLVAGNTVVVQLYDAVEVVDTAKVGTRYYKGVTDSITVVA